MGVLASIGTASGNLSLAGSAISLAQATKSLIVGNDLPPGIAGFLFDIPETATVAHASQITDHWVEDNTSIQDHVAIEPIKITLTGKVAELVYTKTKAAAYADTVLNNLSALKLLEPGLSQSAAEHISAAEQLQQSAASVLKQAGTLTGLFQGSEANLNNQQKAYQYFKTLFESRALLTVETPFQTYQSMIIESFESLQDESTTTVSSFTINFKQLRTISVQVGTGKLQGRIKEQKSATVNKGQQQGTSIITAITGIGQ